MAQTVPHGMSNGVGLPPGLDADGSGSGATVSGTGAPAASDAGHPRSEQQGLVDEVRRSVLEEVDAKMADKMKTVWSSGNKMIKKLEEETLQKNAEMRAELQKCREKQDALQLENEQLKACIARMVPQMNMLVGYFGGLAVPKLASPVMATSNGAAHAEPSTGSTSATDGVVDSSPEFAFGAGSYPPLPAVPDFPFPTSPALPTPATPLSLAEALGSEAPTSASVPVSLMGSLPPPSQGQKIFSFTLRKADNTVLGLNVSHQEEDKALRVEGVRPEGAVEAWNRQCVGSSASEKAIIPGDRIISVNGVVNDPAKMLEECRDKQLLKLTVVRGEAPVAPKTPGLRADAPEFVPPGCTTSPAPGLTPGLEAISEKPEPPAEDETARRVWTEDADKEESAEKPADC